MKYIHKKSGEPDELTAHKRAATLNWQPTYNNLDKKPIKQALMHEQGEICCYCESRLDVNDSHIEHLIPQSDPACDPLDYGNMLCSCLSNLKKGEPRHCGVHKGNHILPVTPLDARCERLFDYTADGAILPAANSEEARESIAILQLDIPKLRAKRRDAIAPFLDGTLSSQEFDDFVNGYLQKDAHGRFSPFHTTIARIFTNG